MSTPARHSAAQNSESAAERVESSGGSAGAMFPHVTISARSYVVSGFSRTADVRLKPDTTYSTLRRRCGWDALLRGLMEGVRRFDQARLAAGRARDADAERTRLRVDPTRERGRRSVRHQSERHDDDRIAGASRKPGPAAARRQDSVESVCLQHAV